MTFDPDAPALRRRRPRPQLARRDVLRGGVWLGVGLGVLYGLAQLLQTVGLEHTSASVSGFVTGTYVVLTPLFGAVLLRDRISREHQLPVDETVSQARVSEAVVGGEVGEDALIDLAGRVSQRFRRQTEPELAVVDQQHQRAEKRCALPGLLRSLATLLVVKVVLGQPRADREGILARVRAR